LYAAKATGGEAQDAGMICIPEGERSAKCTSAEVNGIFDCKEKTTPRMSVDAIAKRSSG
jgi:hypothetical protein